MPVSGEVNLRAIEAKGVASGAIRTDMMQKPFNSAMGEFSLTQDKIPAILNRDMAEPWEIAASIAFLLGDESRYVTKAAWYHDGGWVEGSFSS